MRSQPWLHIQILWRILKTLVSRLHFTPIKSESLEVGSRHQRLLFWTLWFSRSASLLNPVLSLVSYELPAAFHSWALLPPWTTFFSWLAGHCPFLVFLLLWFNFLVSIRLPDLLTLERAYEQPLNLSSFAVTTLDPLMVSSSSMILQTIYILMAHKFLFPAQSSPRNSRLAYPSAFLTPYLYVWQLKFNKAKNKLLIAPSNLSSHSILRII